MSAPALTGPDIFPGLGGPSLGAQQTPGGQRFSGSGRGVRTEAAEATRVVRYGQGTGNPEEREGQILGTRTSVALASLGRARVTVRASPSTLSGLLCPSDCGFGSHWAQGRPHKGRFPSHPLDLYRTLRLPLCRVGKTFEYLRDAFAAFILIPWG